MPKKKVLTIGPRRKYHYIKKSDQSTKSSTTNDLTYASLHEVVRKEDSFWRLPWLDFDEDKDCDGINKHENTDSDGIYGNEVTDSDGITCHEVNDCDGIIGYEVTDSDGITGHEVTESDGITGHEVTDSDGITDHEVTDSDGITGHEVTDSDGITGHEVTESDGITGHEVTDSDGITGHEFTDCDGITGHEFYVILDKAYQYHYTVNLEDFVHNVITGVIFSRLKTKLENSNHPAFVNMPSSKYIRYIQCYDSVDPNVKMSVTILPTLKTPDIHVHSMKLSCDHEVWKSLPIFKLYTSKKKIWTLLDKLAKYNVCAGNFDAELQDFVPIGRGTKINGSEYAAFREGDYSAIIDDYTYHSTIRCNKCLLLVNGVRCRYCSVYRRSLRKALDRHQVKPPVSSVNWLKSMKGESRMSEPEKLEKLKQFRKYTNELEYKCRMLERQVSQLKSKDVKLSRSENDDCASIAGNTKRQQLDQQISNQLLPKRPKF